MLFYAIHFFISNSYFHHNPGVDEVKKKSLYKQILVNQGFANFFLT